MNRPMLQTPLFSRSEPKPNTVLARIKSIDAAIVMLEGKTLHPQRDWRTLSEMRRLIAQRHKLIEQYIRMSKHERRYPSRDSMQFQLKL